MKALLALMLLIPNLALAQGWHPIWVRIESPPQTDGKGPAEVLEVFYRSPGTQTWLLAGTWQPWTSWCPKWTPTGYVQCDSTHPTALPVNIPKNMEVMAWLKRGDETSPMSNIVLSNRYKTSRETLVAACKTLDINYDGTVDDPNDRWICAELLAGRFE